MNRTMSRKDPRRVQVACLSNIVDLQRTCQEQHVNLSQETNSYLLYLTLRKLGPILSQKLVKKLVDKGDIEWDDNEGFEVEAILDHHEADEKHHYLIKWKGWSHEHNTWEPKEHMDCEDLMQEFHDKQAAAVASKTIMKKFGPSIEEGQQTNKQKIDDIFARINKSQETITPMKLLDLSQSPTKRTAKRFQGLITSGGRVNKIKYGCAVTNKRTKKYKVLKAEMQKAIKNWETHLNAINTDPAPITVENNVDLEGPPQHFVYINDYKEGEGITIPQDPIVGCECENCFDEKKTCCGPNAGAEFAYYKHSKVRLQPGVPIYECNKRCKCGPECPNRVVQHGRKSKVCIFRTSNNRGWGVKALQRIKKGSFVMEYVGEVITNEEAERRGKTYDAEGMTYLFDLDYNDSDCPFTVDAGFMGNVSHFVNHSCDPNLKVFGVWINTLDPRLPRIALFASKDIDKGEELTFDYMMTGDTTQGIHPMNHATLSPRPKLERNNNDVNPMDTDAVSVDQDGAKNEIMTNVLVPDLNTTSSVSPSPAMKYRIMCQCGASNCRKYLF